MTPSPYETPYIRHLIATQEHGDEKAEQEIAAELSERDERAIAKTPTARMRMLKENIARRERFIQKRKKDIQELQTIPGLDEAVRVAIAEKEEIIKDFDNLNAKYREAL